MAPWDGLLPGERIAVAGAAAVAASLLLPWYGIELELFGGFSQTGLEAFDFAHAAMLVTAAGVIALVSLCAGGYRLPRPLSEGGLLVAAGAWIGLVVAYMALDPPAEIAGFDRVRLRYGLIVAFGGAAAVALGGVRARRPTEPGPAGD